MFVLVTHFTHINKNLAEFIFNCISSTYPYIVSSRRKIEPIENQLEETFDKWNNYILKRVLTYSPRRLISEATLLASNTLSTLRRCVISILQAFSTGLCCGVTIEG